MPGPFFEKNVNALKALNIEQAETIKNLSPQVEGRLYQTKDHPSGVTNLYYPSGLGSTFTLFGSQKPKEEIENWIFSTDLKSKHSHAVILLGFDLGYYAREVLACLPESSILAIVEPDPLLFFTAIHYTDISTLIGDKRVHLYVGQKMPKAIESMGTELKWSRFLTLPYNILVNPLLRKSNPNYAGQFATQWRNALQRELMYRNSRIEHGTTVVMNTVQNSEALIESPGVDALFGQFEKVPAVLAAAGPSLERNLENLKLLQKNALITCVNSAYPILRAHGIQPHIVFTMDHQERNWRSFEGDRDKPSAFLIADPRIQPQIVSHFMPHVFFATWRTTTESLGDPQPLDQIPVPEMSGNALYLWLQELTGPKGDVYGPGSVAVVGYHILARMGCESIILLGQDLAFTDDKTYANGTIFDDQALPRDAEKAHLVESVQGGNVSTSETLYLYRQLLEHEIARFNITTLNASTGAVIKGSIATTLDSVMEKLRVKEVEVLPVLKQIHQAHPSRIIFRDLQRKLQEGIDILERFTVEAKSGLYKVPDTLTALSNRKKKQLLYSLKEHIARCSTEFKDSLHLLNELLQEAHFSFEESQWNRLKPGSGSESLDEEILANSRVLDAFVRQATLLATLFEEKIAQIG